MRDTGPRDVSALVDRVSVSIDGVSYELRHPDELSILDRIAVSRWASDASSAALCQLCALVLLAPGPVLGRLTDLHRGAISQAFFSIAAPEAPHQEEGASDEAPSGSIRGDWSAHVPRLQRFYGGDVMTWLADVPVVVVEAFTRMLPRLQAEEALADAERMAVGAGNRTPEFNRSATTRWMATAGVKRAVRKATSPEEFAAMGINVVFEPVPAKEAPSAAAH